MKTAPLAVAFREVRHFKPEDWLHCEPVALRGEAMDWTIPAHRHEGLHQFMFLARGLVEVLLDDVPQPVAAPALLMVAPGCVHALRFQRGSAGQQITVPSARVRSVLADAPALVDSLAVSRVLQGAALGGEAERVGAICAALAEEFAADAPGRAQALQAHLVLLVTWFLRRVVPVAVQDSRAAVRDTLVQRYRALVEIHLRRHQTLAFYAETLKVTADHLSRTCRAVAGQSALDLLHERMLLEARRLLAYTDAPVTEIARDLGFEDPSYFSRFFARRAGRSPQEWRAALQTGQETPP
jgi:AraC family transcriptional activator of pobA